MFCRKRSAFETQFHLIIAVSIFLKTCRKNRGDTISSHPMLERRILLVCVEALLLAVL